MPIARPDHAVTAPDRTVTIPVLANDTATGPDPLAVVELGQAASGDVAVTTAGEVTYTPQGGFIGLDRFTYAAGDGAGVAAAEVTVEVRPSNGPPRPAPDSILTLAGQAVLIEPLANDADHDHDRLRLSGFSLPEHGTLALQSQQRLLYTPEPDFAGEDGFRYRLADLAGNEAESEVRISVLALNEPPVAVPDQVTVEAGMSLTIDPVANDLDPDGDPLRLVSVTLPRHGRLAVMADRRLVYTANDGHLGSDGFSYTVRDRQGALATGSVAITVTAPASPTAYLNGYRYRRRLVVPAASVTGRHEGFPLLVREQGAWLKSRASGGRLDSEAGLDLRFETADGTRLDHELAHYDPALGELAAWVRLPVLDAAAETGLVLYYGKPGLATGEADPKAVWHDYLAVWHLPDGTDRSGHERHLVASGTVETVPGPLGRAARLAGAGVFRRPDVAWLDGLAALTCQIWATASDIGHDQGLFTVGPIDGRDSVVGLAVRYVAQGSEESNLLAFIQAQADGRSRLESAAESQTSARQAISAVWAQGDRPGLYLDGTLSAPSAAPAVPRLSRLSIAEGPLTIAAGPRDTMGGGWRGLIDEVRLRAAALSAGWLSTEHANLADPRGFYGLGGEEAFGTDAPAPLARPVRASTPHGRTLEIDLLATASAPVAAPVAIVEAPAHGVAALIGGSRLRYTPAPGFTGADGLAFTIGSGHEASTARLVIEVTQESDRTDPDQDRPYGGRFYGMGLHAVSPGNTRFYQDTPVSMRFKAERSGTIQGLRWEMRRNTKYYPNPHRYSEGNGGRVVIELRRDADGRPDMSAGGLLARTQPNNGDARPLCVRAPEWGADYWKVNPARAGHETWSFGSGGAVTAGQTCHLVFVQLEPKAAVSINALHNGTAQAGPDWSGPYFGEAMQVMRDANDGRGFRTSALNSNGPLAHDLIYSDGQVTGTPLTYMGPPEMEIGGAKMVRQRFTVTDYGRTVDGVWLAAYRKGGSPTDLLVHLEREDGTALATASLLRAALPAFERDVSAHRWTKAAFGRACELARGQTYHVRLSAATGTYYARAGINATDRGGFRNRNICWTKANARAQYSSNGGASWRNWDIPDWGSFDRPDMSLALLLTVVPD